MRERLAARADRGYVVIDEVQRVPELLPVVHGLIEQKTGHRFIPTGSSTRIIRRAGVNLLGGRAILSTLHPFLLAELGPSFGFEQAPVRGLLPVVVASDEPDRTLGAYAALYLREEVQAEALVLKSFRDEFPRGQTILLYRGKERFVRNGVTCIPCGEFLAGLRPDVPLAGLLGRAGRQGR